VVTPERDSLQGNVLVLDDPGRGLNAALDAARRELLEREVDELVVLHADLPLVSASDSELLVSRGRRTGFALAPDTAGSGTNALYLAAPAVFRFHFGVDSCRRHLEEGACLGLAAALG
jgi:2-phospho-L-lactate guanylyltransferase (CobY/MobA/RfbA family)